MNIRIIENIETALQVIIECRKADDEVMKLKNHIELFDNIKKVQGANNIMLSATLVKHIGRTQLVGEEADAMEHFMKVNRCSQMDYHAALAAANEEYRRRNKIEGWTTDITWLKNRFGLEIGVPYGRK